MAATPAKKKSIASAAPGASTYRSEHQRDVVNRLKRIEDTVNLIDKAIRGNGVPGLKEEVRVLQARDAARSRLFWIVVGTAVAQVATLGVAALFYVHAALVR